MSKRRIFFVVGPNRQLTPAGAADYDMMERFTPGAVVSADPSQPRNARFHRLYWACVALLLPHQELYPTVGDLHEAIKMALGYFDMRTNVATGAQYPRTKSIAFDKMDEPEFHAFFDKFVLLADTRIVPNSKGVLEQQWREMLDGEPEAPKRRTTKAQALF